MIILLLICSCAFAGPALEAVKLDSPPEIDGDLSDACWQSTKAVSDFYYSNAGVPAGEKTFAWLAYDDDCIYAAFDCKDSQPELISAQQKKRGGDLDQDDYVYLFLDLFSEYRGDTLSFFAVNPLGTQTHSVYSAETAKTEWTGDWRAAAKRNPDGYTVEMEIPFSILRYDQKNPRISVCFSRVHHRLDQQWFAPDLGKRNDPTNFYFWEGVKPAIRRPKPVTLLYSLLGTGSGDADSTGRVGADIKYSLTPGLTGLLTINPYFRDVEQEVDSIDFTYNERVLGDNRLFFREGKQYFPGSVIFYTRKIQEIDAGAKVVGRMGDYQLGLMNARRFGHESYTVGEITRQFGRNKEFSIWTGGVLSEVEGSDYLSTWTTVDYTWRHKNDKATDFHYTFINTEDDDMPGHGGFHNITLSMDNGPRKLNAEVSRQIVEEDYNPYLGASRDTDMKAWGLRLELWDSPETGSVSGHSLDLWTQVADHFDGSRFYTTIEPSFSLYWRNGRWVELSYENHKRYNPDPAFPVFRDRFWSLDYGWGRNDLYRRGGIEISFGDRAGGEYSYLYLSQGFKLSDTLSMQAWTEYSKIGAPSPYAGTYRQTVVSANYDISPEKGVVARWIRREGSSNIYAAYRQRVRAGLDAYLIYGDPNADEIRDTILLKLIRPL